MAQVNRTTNALLAAITVALGVIAVGPYVRPTVVAAQAGNTQPGPALTGNTDPVYVEPGVFTLRQPDGQQVLGKVVVNLRTGAVYGFPTGSPDPYPVSPLDGKPQVSRSIPLGRFAVGDITH